MKKIYFTLAIVAIALTSVFALSSCSKEDDGHSDEINPEDQGTPSYQYDANGLWRLEANGVKYTLEVKMPSSTTTGTVSANFYYNDNTYEGYAELKNDVLTFETKASEKLKVAIKGTFTDNDSQKFTGDLSIDGNAVATGATFSHMVYPTNYVFSIYYTVVDPDNELSAMGTDTQSLTEEVKACNGQTTTENTDSFSGLAYLLALQLDRGLILKDVMDAQCERYPQLLNSNVYVDIKVISTFGDINTTYSGSKITYAAYK